MKISEKIKPFYIWIGIYVIALSLGLILILSEYLEYRRLDILAVEHAKTLNSSVHTGILSHSRFGPERKERIEDLANNIIQSTDINYICIKDLNGNILIESGSKEDIEMPVSDNPYPVFDMNDNLVVSSSLFRLGPAGRNQMGRMGQGMHGYRHGVGTPDDDTEQEDMLGEYRLFIQTDVSYYTDIQKNVIIRIVVTLIILSVLGAALVVLKNKQKKEVDYEKNLALSNEKNKQLEALTQIGAGLAHEIKNPLNVIGGFIQHIRSQFTDNEEQLQNINIMINQIDRISNRINEFLRFSRPHKVKKQETLIVSIVQEVINLVKQEADYYGIKISLNVQSEQDMKIYADQNLVREALLNVFLNAIAAIKGEGSILARIYKNRHKTIIRIEDSGPGFTEEAVHLATKPYYTTKETGVGLGLSIVQRIMDDHFSNLQWGNNEQGGAYVELAFEEGKDL